MTVTCIGVVIWWKMLFAPETLARRCYSICQNYNIFSGCSANSLHCYLLCCFGLILCRHYLELEGFLRTLFLQPHAFSILFATLFILFHNKLFTIYNRSIFLLIMTIVSIFCNESQNLILLIGHKQYAVESTVPDSRKESPALSPQHRPIYSIQ